MGWFKKFAEETQQQFDDGLTAAIGDGDYTIKTDRSTVKRPQDDGKDDQPKR